MLGEELIDDLGEELVGYESWVVCVGYDDAGYAFGPAVGVECVGFLFDVLSLAGAGAFGHGFAE